MLSFFTEVLNKIYFFLELSMKTEAMREKGWWYSSNKGFCTSKETIKNKQINE